MTNACQKASFPPIKTELQLLDQFMIALSS